MAHAVARRALRVLTQVETASRWLPVEAGHFPQTLNREDDGKKVESELVQAQQGELGLPKLLNSQVGGFFQKSAACIPTSLPRQFELSCLGTLSHPHNRLLHSSIACQETALGQAAEAPSTQAPGVVAAKSDAVADTKALLRTATLTVLREQLRDHERAWVSLPELYKICKETGKVHWCSVLTCSPKLVSRKEPCSELQVAALLLSTWQTCVQLQQKQARI